MKPVEIVNRTPHFFVMRMPIKFDSVIVPKYQTRLPVDMDKPLKSEFGIYLCP